ncbi:MFS transporter [Fodinicola feengrottensis]|uniref:MFS transporter n=1 Tax=Fodinicola feengrottensis TaxID=435914 RepID=A0ABN2HYP8_9ACTN
MVADKSTVGWSDADQGSQPWSRELPKAVVALFAAFTAFGITVPVLPVLITGRLHGSSFEVGLTFALNAITALVVRPYAGQFAQRVGTRPAMLLGCGLAAASTVFYVLPLGIPGILVGRIMMGAGSALLFVGGAVWIVAMAPTDRRGQWVGLYGLGPWSGLIAGPIVGDLLFRVGSYPLAWTVAAGLPLLAVMVVLWLKKVAGQGASTSRSLLPRSVVLPGLALAAGAFGYGTVTSFGVLAFKSHGFGSGSLALGLFSVGYLVTRLLTSRVPDKVAPVRLIAGSSIAEAVGLALMGFAPAFWMGAVGAVLAGAGFTLFQPVLALITIKTAPEAERGAALGALSSFLDIGVTCAGLGGGVIATASTPAATFPAAAVVVLAAIIVVVFAARRRSA